MVMDVLTSFRRIPLNSVSISSMESMATPTFPTSPSAKGDHCRIQFELVNRKQHLNR